MELRPITPQPGNDRDPMNFVGRVHITSQARELLKHGTNLLLTDPRRMGKTFWMRTFAAQEADFHCYFIDYEGVFTAHDFLFNTAEALIKERNLPERALNKLKTIFDNCDLEISPGPITLKTYHQQTSPHVLLTKVLAALDDDEDDAVPVVMMDEVPMAINNIADREGASAAEEVLQTLRALRQKTTRVRWIITGSVGFHHTLKKTNMTQGVLNDLESLRFGPLSNEEAKELAHRLLLGVGQDPNEAIVDELISKTGGIPFLLQKVVGTLARQQYGVFKPSDIEECFEDFIDDPDEFRWFEHYLTRVTPHYGANEKIANQILQQTLSMTNEWVPIDSLPQDDIALEVLEDLIKDHYLARRGSTVRWRYPALQYIWARKKRVWDRR